jgi:hypothetical protein
MRRSAACAALPLGLLLGIAQRPLHAEPADLILHGGTVLTLDAVRPSAEAVAVRDGRIVAVGSLDEMRAHTDARTQLRSLEGRTLLPGFVDAHGHVSFVGFQAMSANLLAPPDGPATSIAALQQTLRVFLEQSPHPARFGVLFGVGYDDAQLAEQRHPTRDDLDAVSRDVPVVAIHQSGHLAALNSRALERAGIRAESADPQGGVIRRRTGSREPNGVLEELAFFGALRALYPKLDGAQAIAMLEEGLRLYARHGFTTVQDGRASPDGIRTAIAAAEAGRLNLDVVAYPDVFELGEPELMREPWLARKYTKHFRVGGVKLTLDGSPQGKTAWLSQPYFEPPEGRDPGYAGYGVLKDDAVIAAYTQAFRNGWQILTHANGDAAIDQMIRCMRSAAQQVPGRDRRPVLIHGQTLREDQIDALVALGIFPSLFPMHTFYWGDWHRTSVLGPERARNISPTGWLRARGLRFTSHHDAPVALPDAMRVLSATVNRATRSGFVLGPEHRVPPLEALEALTLSAAHQHFEEASKGSIEVGKLADFVVLSANPLRIDPAKLSEIRVLETIKEGVSVYRADDAISAGSPREG